VGNRSAVVLLSSANWDEAAARAALGEAVEGLWTASRLGVAWTERKQGAHAYQQLDGLAQVALAARGPVLVVSDSPEMLAATLDRLSKSSDKAEAGAVYAAGFRHARERDNFYQMMRWMDYPSLARSESSEGREPMFFSENLAGLSRSLAAVEDVSMITRQDGDKIRQTVIYKFVQ
jgi:hypothetical protein